MKLKSIEYSQFAGDPEEWKLEKCIFTDINLIVGKNATGKTRLLNIIKGLANLLARQRKLSYLSGNFTVNFNQEGKEIVYTLRYKERKVIEEKLSVDSELLLDRGQQGKGKIFAQQLGQRIEFQAPEDEIAAFSRRDSIQHPFFEDLYNWGNNLIHFYFGTPLGKDSYAAFIKMEKSESEIDLRETDKVVAIFKRGERKFKESFTEAIKKDFSSAGYKIESIRTGQPRSIIVESPTPFEGLIVKETDRKAETDQNDMSQGMFRVLSLIIQLNYAQIARIPSCILIDDVGEGLDYERSTNLIKLLIKKVKKTNVQLIMTTNDRFVMNSVPLQYWSIIHRIGNACKILNYQNARKKFENFELTGLSNFDLFSSNYFLENQDDA
jgi:energy-coupling factor transporter ATP-binding protein EcfA2